MRRAGAARASPSALPSGDRPWGVDTPLGHREKGLGTLAGARLRHIRPCGKDRRARLSGSDLRRSPVWRNPHRCCRSSVVEHPLGKGEVVSSILTGSTTTMPRDVGPFATSSPPPARATRRHGAKRNPRNVTAGLVAVTTSCFAAPKTWMPGPTRPGMTVEQFKRDPLRKQRGASRASAGHTVCHA